MKIAYISSTASGMRSKGIYYDLMQEFIRNGHEVHCIYAEEKRNGFNTRRYNENGIKYLGVKTGNIEKNPNLINKAFATVSIDSKYLSAIKKHLGNQEFDLVLYSTPPITFIKTLKYFRMKNTPIYLMLKDVFPQNAVDLEMFNKQGLIHKFFKRKEIQNYNAADYIGVMSEANMDYILNEYPYLESKMKVLPNSINTDTLPVKKFTRKDLNLPEDDLIVIYGGNLGKPQSPDFIIECMNQVEKRDDISFIICGTGACSEQISNHIKSNNLKKTQYLGQKNVEDFEQITLNSDIGLIFLDYRFTIPNFPQRLLSYLGASLPVVCATDKVTDIGTIAENNKFGISVPSNDSSQWIQKIISLSDDSTARKCMGKNGKEYLKSNYDVKQSYQTIINQIYE